MHFWEFVFWFFMIGAVMMIIGDLRIQAGICLTLAVTGIIISFVLRRRKLDRKKAD